MLSFVIPLYLLLVQGYLLAIMHIFYHSNGCAIKNP